MTVRCFVGWHVASLVLLFVLPGCGDRPQMHPTLPAPPAATSGPMASAADREPARDAIRGIVTDPDGRAVPGARVSAMAPLTEWLAKGPLGRIVRTDVAGRFAIDRLPPGAYAVTASAPGMTSAVTKAELDGSKPPAPLTIPLERDGFEVNGRVLDERGVPLVGAQVDALEARPDNAYPSHAALSDEAGRYTLGLLEQTPYLLVASTPDRHRTYQRLEPRAQTMDLMLSRPATPRPSDEVLRAWLEADSIPLAGADPKASLEDLEPLKDVIGSARIVALGEATHGSAELFQLKHRMLRLLVERMGFATVAFEVGFAEALAVDAYIHGGKGSAEAVVRGLVTDAFATEENVALVEWMRRYNADARHTRKISFVGFDMTTWTSAKAATKYLADAGMRDAAAEAALATLGTLGADVRYAAAPAEVREATREAITRVVAALDGKRDVLIAKTSAPAYRIARWHARVVEQAERSYRDPTLRDALMADNVEALRADAPDARIALWLHNAHATAWPAMFEDMGRRLRRKHGKDHVVVGTAFGSGGLRALSARDVEAGPQEHRLADPPPDSFEAALALAGKPCFAIDLRRSEAAVRDWLASPIAVWSVGFAFHGREASIMRMPPALAFDAVIYIDHVTAARGLPRRGGG